MVGGEQKLSRFRDEAMNEDYDVQLRLSDGDRNDPQTIDRLYRPAHNNKSGGRPTDGPDGAGLVQLPAISPISTR